MNTCPPVQPCFCPQADSPVSGTLLPQGGPAAVIQVPIYGTQGFSVSIISNPTLPISLVPLISSATIQNGNILTLVTAVPAIDETLGPYVATIRVCNACGTLDLQVQVDVVADLNPVVTNCLLAQQLWTPEGREPTVGDTLLAFTPAGCRALLPPPTACEAIQAFPGVVPTLVTQLATADCGLATVLDVLALYDLCGQLNTFPAGAPLSPADRVIALQGLSCVQSTVQDVVNIVEANIDVCTLLQNLPNAVVQPTAVFYGQQAGQCFEFAVADLLALVPPPVIACPLLATCDGSCAAPAYSFASQPTSGMWMNGGILTLSTNNCDDLIEIGASVNITSNFGTIFANAGVDFIASASGNVAMAGSGTGAVASGNTLTLSSAGANVAVAAATTISFSTSATLRFTIDGAGAWVIGGTPGAAGQAIVSGGPGVPPTWATPSATAPLSDVQDATAAATRNHGSNIIDWAWDFTSANRFIMRDNTNGDERFVVGTASSLSGRRGDGTASLIARSAGGIQQANIGVSAHPTQPTASMNAFIGATTSSVSVTTAGNQFNTNGSNGNIFTTDRDTFRTGAGQGRFMVGPYSALFATGNLLRVDGTANGGTPVLAAEGASDANVSLSLLPKGTGSVLAPVLTVTTDNGYRASSQTSGAGASAGTLANAPSAGNPAFWLRVVINGVNHFIPAWT